MQAFDYVNGRDAEGFSSYDGIDDTSYYDGVDDTEGLFDFVADIVGGGAKAAVTGSSLPPAAKKAALHAVHEGSRKIVSTVGEGFTALTNNPLWDIVQTGVSFIPGVGQAVSAGMASAAAVGRGESIADIGLAAARNAIPGGPLVQAGLDIAIGAVRGQNLGDNLLKQVRARIPGGELGKGAFDAGVAIIKNLGPSQVETIRRNQTPQARQQFDAALAAHRNPQPVDPMSTEDFWIKAIAAKALMDQKAALAKKPRKLVHLKQVPRTSRPANPTRPFPHLGAAPNRVAAHMLTRPEVRRETVQQITASVPMVDQRDARKAVAAFLTRFHGQRVFDWNDVGEYDSIDSAGRRHDVDIPGDLGEWPEETGAVATIPLPNVAIPRSLLRELYKRGDTNIKKAILAHGLLAHIARNTGELSGSTWTIRTGDNPWKVAETLTGAGNRWKEIAKVNPTMPVINNGTALKGWYVGKTFQVPPSWIATVLPLPSAGVAPVAFVSRPGGPPFPAPSEYPNGYPSSTYIVKSGDTGEKIAARITGDKDRWRELLTTNPKRASKQYGFAIYAGDRITLPSQWVSSTPVVTPTPPVVIGGDVLSLPSPGGFTKPMPASMPIPDTTPHMPAEAMPQPSVSTTTIPGSMPTSGVVVVPQAPTIIGSPEQLGSIQTLLASFYRQHVDATYSMPGAVFGSKPEDLSGVWDARTEAAFAGFQKWWNARGKPPHLSTDGMPDDATVAALVTQVKEDTGAGAPTTVAEKTSPTSSATTATAKKSTGGGIGPLLLLLPFLA